jgi:hypothetical protein
MIKDDVGLRVVGFDRDASEKFENMAEKLLGAFEGNGQQLEGLKGLANLLLRRLRSVDSGSVVHAQGLENVMRGVSRAIDHPDDMHYITSSIQRGLGNIKDRVPEEILDEV